MTVKIITLGCKVNQYESQAMLEALLAAGFTQAAPDEAAGVVVVNSCTVTAQSDHKVRQALRRAKKDNPGAVTVLTGCMPQAGRRPVGGGHRPGQHKTFCFGAPPPGVFGNKAAGGGHRPPRHRGTV